MKKLIAGTLALMISFPSFAGYWYAEAHSGSAYGWGQSGSRIQAQNIALRECAYRTPNWDSCFVTTSYWVN